MRSGGCTVQHTLTAEAAGVVKHAVALARQRGHAQVTPLHVAATMLAPGAMSLLRRACLKSHPYSNSHPLQCRALECCFKVALNRLPTAAGSVVQPGQPSLSNSLVAVLKRAQANQRRGCVEQQQQAPLLGVKVEMEQLIISILDDPSVSRVMREAGFSSTCVKNKLEEESVSLTFPSSGSLDHHNSNEAAVSRSANGLIAEAVEMGCGGLYSQNNNNNARFSFFEKPVFESLRSSGSLKNKDVESVLEVLLGRKTRRINSVIVGDCLLSTENVVREVMSRIGRGDVPDPLRGVQFITPHFSTLSLSREQVEQKLSELRRTVNNCLVGGSAIIYAGDLRWAVENNHIMNGSNNYCAVDHISMELGRMLGSHAESRRVWLMATATYETYMRCQKRQPSLEALWGIQAVPVPSGGLTLTLQPSSSSQAESKINSVGGDVLLPIPHNIMWPVPFLKTVNLEEELVGKFICCSECSAKFEAEAECVRQQENKLVSNDGNLPVWLQQCKSDNVCRKIETTAQMEGKLGALRKKWNQICRNKHSHWEQRHERSRLEFPQQVGSGFSVNTVIPWWSHAHSHGGQAKQAWSAVSSNTPSSPAWSHHQHHFSQGTPDNARDSSIDSVEDFPRLDVKTTLALGLADSSFKANADNYVASTQLTGASSLGWTNLTKSDPESLKQLSDKLAEKVPWQSEEIVRAVAMAVLDSRRSTNNVKGETWLLALGPDRMGKRKMAQALAQIIYGSQDKLICLHASPWSRGQIDDEAVNHNFRGKPFLDRLAQAISRNPHSVVLLEDIENADGVLMGAIVKAMERGKLMDSEDREVSLSDTIVFMSSTFGANYFTNCRSVKGTQFDEDKLSQAISGPSWGLKLVVQEDQEQVQKKLWQPPSKRKAEWDLMQVKETEKKNRQSPALDLNVETEEEQADGAADDEVEQDHEDEGNRNPSHKILCCARKYFPQQFLESEKCVVFRPFDFAHLAESLLDRLHDSYGKATSGRGSLEVEGAVVERMVSCCWEMAPSHRRTFHKWVEEVFEVGLTQMLSRHTLTAETIVKLSAADHHGSARDSFYAHSNLPARIEIINSCSNHARFS